VGEDKGAHGDLPNAHIGTVEQGIENERGQTSSASKAR
jgi:hypothetical protein